MKDILYAEIYTDKNGEKKARWHICGMLFEKDGKESIKINTLFNFAGAKTNEKGELWLPVKEHKNKEQAPKAAAPQYAPSVPDEDVPF